MMKYSVVVLCIVATGCGGQPLDRHEYLLRPPVMAGVIVPENGTNVVRLGKVEVAPYLDQNGIALGTGTAEIHAGKQHVWAEPLNHGIERYLQVTIGREGGVVVEVAPLTTGTQTPELEVRIHQFHGSVDGEVRLVAEWTVSESEDQDRLYRFDSRRRQATDGYPALIEAHGLLLDELAGEIARSLN